jgi:hypothetical protein
LAGLEGAADQGGMSGNFQIHRAGGGVFIGLGQMNSIKAYQLQGQKRTLRQLFPARGIAAR